MQVTTAFRMAWFDWFDPTGREKHIKEYIALGNRLVWQRQVSFFAAAALTSIYFDPISSFICYTVVILTEVLDQLLGREAEAWDGVDRSIGRYLLKRIVLNTGLSALAISLFVINIANQQILGGHFTPLFFLFSAALFAAMYNSQMIGILLLRLAIYSGAFLYIAFLDVFRFSPPLSSRIWLEFFTIIFVLYFIADTSVKFYLGYRQSREQMKRIKEEHARTQAALEVKSQFLATVSHELRTPMTSIAGSLQLIDHGALGEVPQNIKTAISMAARNGQRLAALIDDLLDLQQMEAGEVSLKFEQVELKDLAHDAVESLRGYAAKFKVHIVMADCDEEFWIMADRSRTIQVLNNLLSNAIKFSYEGGTVTVRVENRGATVRLSVQDHGKGIPKGVRDRVFGRFSQVDSSDSRGVGGTGLGLSITKQIVERHNAVIDYDSELGLGSTFFVDFERLITTSDQSLKEASKAEYV